jgi:LL-diaminopimelate aminotransferase
VNPIADRVARLEPYTFAELDRKAALLKAEGLDPIDFGVGDPTSPTPAFIRAAAQEGIEKHRAGGYPTNAGEPEFREAAAAWILKRFDSALDPEKEINITLGSKEAIFNVHEAFVNPGDVVISPSPGYPPYARGALFSEGVNYFYPLSVENEFLPDLDAIPAEVLERARIFWICQPHVPTGTIMYRQALDRVADLCARNDILLCSDEAYIDLYYDVPPDSLIQHRREGVLVFHSLSKRSSMTGYRCGFVAGDASAIETFRKVKTNIDSGVPRFVQDAARAALADEAHVKDIRDGYRRSRDLLVDGLAGCGLPRCAPEAGLYIWQRAPASLTGKEIAERFLQPDLALITSPGEWLANSAGAAGENPGRDYVRLAFVPPLARIEEAVRRLCKVKPGEL